jgi:hypothetical protein
MFHGDNSLRNQELRPKPFAGHIALIERDEVPRRNRFAAGEAGDGETRFICLHSYVSYLHFALTNFQQAKSNGSQMVVERMTKR